MPLLGRRLEGWNWCSQACETLQKSYKTPQNPRPEEVQRLNPMASHRGRGDCLSWAKGRGDGVLPAADSSTHSITQLCIYIYIYISVCMYVRMYVCMYACRYVCIYIEHFQTYAVFHMCLAALLFAGGLEEVRGLRGCKCWDWSCWDLAEEIGFRL